MSLNSICKILITAILLLVAPLASAHPGHAGAGLVDGFMHPATGIDHLLVAIAAGYWAARRDDHGLHGHGLFMGLFVAGILLGAAGIRWFQVDITPALMLVLIVVVITVAIGATSWFLHALFGSLALYQGVQHMAGMPADTPLTGFALGLVLATGVLLLVGQMVRHVVSSRTPHSP
jgi:urease accessory protein